MSKIYFTSDTHFGSKRTLELSKRPFKTVDEMDRVLIDKWNSVVTNDDMVYHLGDFGKYDYLKKLNGNKILLFGNYERDELSIFDNDALKKKFKKHFQTDLLFEPTLLDNIYPDHKIIISHEPMINKLSIKDGGICNLFGHIHRLQMVKRYGLNVGVDCHHYYPIDVDTIVFYINAITNHYDEFVFE